LRYSQTRQLAHASAFLQQGRPPHSNRRKHC
jgi:hypothetical protein